MTPSLYKKGLYPSHLKEGTRKGSLYPTSPMTPSLYKKGLYPSHLKEGS
jgi:hypothetical protein